jgi:ectoine hydroxylase-related dioxygenase (phytanoyl-CoA dioxygenase family)
MSRHTDPGTATPSRRVLSQRQIDDFMTDGYLRLGKILDDQQIELLQDEYDREVERARVRGDLVDLAAEDDRPKLEDGQMLQVFSVSTRNLRFRRLAHLDKILDVVEDLIGPNIRLLQAHLLYKPAGHGSVVYWHQDNVYHQCFPPNMVSAWLTLDEVDRDNGAMEMIPGSHLRPNWEDWTRDVESLDTTRATVVELPAGGMMMHHCQALHRSGPNRSNRPRRAVVIRFVPLGTRSPRLHTEEWEFFVHPILRMRI